MNRQLLATVAAITAAAAATAQMERLSAARKIAETARIAELAKDTKSAALKAHLNRAAAKAQNRDGADAAVLASRVATDFVKTNAAAPAKDVPFLFYSVPAMSNVQRLPGVYPFDGKAGRTVRIVAAKDEFEPGAFLVYPLSDLGKVSLTLTPFRTARGTTLPSASLDLKVVKVWYQNKNGWYSYFADTGYKLCPELLLNDEDLIRVDTAKGANYARIRRPDGTFSELWINPPPHYSRRLGTARGGDQEVFAPLREGFDDAETLQPVSFAEGEFRSFFLTVRTTKETPEGLYSGAVVLSKDGREHGRIPVTVKVLPFKLPQPKCYSDRTRDFLVSSYSYHSFGHFGVLNGGDWPLVRRQYQQMLQNCTEHNHPLHMQDTQPSQYAVAVEMEALRAKAGQRTDIMMGSGGFAVWEPMGENAIMARRRADFWDRHVGHHNLFHGMNDEPPAAWIREARPTFEAYHRAGIKFYLAAGDQHFYKGGYHYDWANIANDPTDASSPALWNQVGHGYAAPYAVQHYGPENPAFSRRQNGLAPYLSGYSALCNYAHHLGPYNDVGTWLYRPMVLAYAAHSGMIDTIQWEGFREGVDDIRYATLLLSLADEADDESKPFEVKEYARVVKQYFATLNRESADLNAVRLEMIAHILKLQAAL